MPSVLPTLESAHLSDTGRLRLTHEDACHCDPRMGLFVVCDGLGGRPSGEAASQVRRVQSLNADRIKRILHEVVVDLSDRLREQAEQVESLRGMGATLSALLVDGRHAFIVHAGDSRVYLHREGQMRCLTTDHFRMGTRAPTAVDLMTHPHLTTVNQRLLTQFIGIGRTLEPELVHLQLLPGDRLLLCTDGLTDPVPEAEIGRVLGTPGLPLAEICQQLVAAANADGGPDNITVVAVEYERLRLVERETLRAESPKAKNGRPIGASTKFHAALVELQKDLDWLRSGAREAAGKDKLAAYGAVKRRLGAEAFDHYLQKHAGEGPAHVFHRCVAAHDSEWRRRYEANQSALVPHLVAIVDHAIRLSPLLTGEETAAILSTLWRDWQRVEDRYLAVCRRESFSPADLALEVLIEQMHGSVSTMIGLMQFFPRFMREASLILPVPPG